MCVHLCFYFFHDTIGFADVDPFTWRCAVLFVLIALNSMKVELHKSSQCISHHTLIQQITFTADMCKFSFIER